jgi:hypothetical protein
MQPAIYRRLRPAIYRRCAMQPAIYRLF